jgi:hypothetical protein
MIDPRIVIRLGQFCPQMERAMWPSWTSIKLSCGNSSWVPMLGRPRLRLQNTLGVYLRPSGWPLS